MENKLNKFFLALTIFIFAMSVNAQQVEIDSLIAQLNVTIGDLLRGKSAGVSVTNADGAPGAAFDVLIRGGGTLRGNQHPLYIVDGVEILPAQMDVSNAWETVDGVDFQSRQNLLWAINTFDIEDIQIVKDASASAIYGSRGANGVVIIRTKTGSKKEKEVSWTSNLSFAAPLKKIDFLSPTDYGTYYQTLTGKPLANNLQERNWQDEILRTSISHNHAFAMGGSLRRTDYYFSLTGKQMEGIIPGTGAVDLGLRANISQQLSPRAKITGRFAFLRNSISMQQSASLLGVSSLVNDFGTVPFSNAGENPASWIADYDDNSVSWRVIPQASLALKITDGVDFTVSGGIDFLNKVRFRWMGNQIERGALDNSRAGRAELSAVAYNTDAFLNIAKTLGKHGLQFKTGILYFGDSFTDYSNYGADFSVYSLRAKGIGFASRSANTVYAQSEASTLSGLVTVSYIFDQRYELNGGVRADYLLNFNTSYYPFINGTWNISEENFWKNNLTASVFGKASLHAGWGISGKNEVTSFSNIEKYSLNYGTLWIPYEEMLYFTPWLQTVKNEFNVGFDMEFLSGRLQAGAKYYKADVRDMLSVYNFRPDYYQYEYDGDGNVINKTLVTFDNLHWQNNIRLKRWGIDAYITAIPVKTSRFTWKSNFSFAIDRAVIIDCGLPAWNVLGMTGQAGFTGVSVSGTENIGVTAFVNGKSPGVFYGYVTQGIIGAEHVNMAPPLKGQQLGVGDPKYIDTNGNGQVEETDKVVIGNPNPDFTFGFNNTLIFGKLSISLLFDGSLGNDILNLNLLSWDNVAEAKNVRSSTYENSVTFGGKLPRVGAQGLNEISDRMVEDGSFVRLSNLSANYAIDVDKIKWLSSLDINLFVSNLFVISGYSGYSPDVNSFAGSWSLYGIDAGAYPQARAFSLGFSAKF